MSVFPGPFSLLCFHCHFTVNFPSCSLYAQFGFLPIFLSGILPVSPNILTLCDRLNDKCNTSLFFSYNVAKFHKKTKSSKELILHTCSVSPKPTAYSLVPDPYCCPEADENTSLHHKVAPSGTKGYVLIPNKNDPKQCIIFS